MDSVEIPQDRQGWLRLIGGSLLIVLGIAGIFLPIVPGIILILVGMATMNPDSDRLNGWLAKGKAILSRRTIARRRYGIEEEATGEAEA